VRWTVVALLCGCTLEKGGLDTAPDFLDATAPADTRVADTTVAMPDAATPDVAMEVLEDSSIAMDADADATVDAPPVRCDEPGAVRAEGHCYFVLAGPFEFAKARDACNARMPPAHLVSITSAAEQAIASARGSGDRWIGLIKDPAAPTAKESFRWITGEPATAYDNWALGDPNGGHNCARMMISGQWGDGNCTSQFPAICERD
jgi:hypothetical protein